MFGVLLNQINLYGFFSFLCHFSHLVPPIQVIIMPVNQSHPTRTSSTIAHNKNTNTLEIHTKHIHTTTITIVDPIKRRIRNKILRNASGTRRNSTQQNAKFKNLIFNGYRKPRQRERKTSTTIFSSAAVFFFYYFKKFYL